VKRVSGTDIPRRGPLFRREEKHEIRHLLSVWCAVALSWSFWLMPPVIRYWIADRISDITAILSTTYTRNVRDNLTKAAGGSLSDEEMAAHIKSIFRTSARNFMDLITMARVSARSLRNAITVTEGDWSMIENAIAKGRGVVFVTAHVGCFDFIGQLFRARGYKLTIVTGRTTSRFIFDGVTHLRASRGNALVEPTPSGVRNVIRALRRGECSVFLSDRDFFQNGRPVTFFGHETTLPPGAIRIARDTGAVVVPIFSRRRNRGHEIRIFEPFVVESTRNVDADVDAGLQILSRHLERGISGNLDQWAMFQRVWPAEPPPPVRVFPVGSPLESELLEKVAAALPERNPDGTLGKHPLVSSLGRRRQSEDEPSENSQTEALPDSPQPSEAK
jgi:KDO2-lipid IV(A) lauroyltransferase